MLRIRASENDELRLDRRVPEEYREVGCVFLLQETFVATLSFGGSVECGTFHVSLIDDGCGDHLDPDSSDARDDIAGLDTVDLPHKDRLASGETERIESTAPTTLSDESDNSVPVSLQVHPRIPGYDLLALVGRGGMGLVWKAVQLSTNRMVAVKTIHPRMLGNAKSQKRFQREVELAARLTHPNIVRVVYLLTNGLSVDKIGGDDSRRLLTEGALQKRAAGVLRNDPRLRRILVKALAPQPEQRYQDAGGFAADLREYLEDRLTEVHRGGLILEETPSHE